MESTPYSFSSSTTPESRQAGGQAEEAQGAAIPPESGPERRRPRPARAVTRVWPPVQAVRRSGAAPEGPQPGAGGFSLPGYAAGTPTSPWAGAADSPSPWAAAAAVPLPDAYGVNRLVLLARDPWWLHAYWELAADLLAEARRFRQEGGVLCLRVRETSAESPRWMDFDVHSPVGRWYVDVQVPGRSYQGQLGIRSRDGHFHALLSSNVVETPAAFPSDQCDGRWATLTELWDEILRWRQRLPGPAGASPGISEQAWRLWHRRLDVGSAFAGAWGLPGPGASPGMWSPGISSPLPWYR
ncbi:MAG: DUF4912 domain-containing protein [Firmicutes bacterium]|nr:DUF4912 domain-containing protein [Bacillota bacterium]